MISLCLKSIWPSLNLHIVYVDHLQKPRRNTKIVRDMRFSKYYQNELAKASFEHDMTYEDLKDLQKTTISNIVLNNKTFDFANNSQLRLAS